MHCIQLRLHCGHTYSLLQRAGLDCILISNTVLKWLGFEGSFPLNPNMAASPRISSQLTVDAYFQSISGLYKSRFIILWKKECNGVIHCLRPSSCKPMLPPNRKLAASFLSTYFLGVPRIQINRLLDDLFQRGT